MRYDTSSAHPPTTPTICSDTRSKGRLWRSRWAAIGAAVSVTLGAGGLAIVDATSSAPSSFVSISPMRILDTRSDLGLAGPFASPTGRTLQVTGSVPVAGGGSATVVPPGATGVMLNVTAVTPQADGFISVRPGDAVGAPTTSSLNFGAGDVTPNAVAVALSPTGNIDITYDAYGTAGPTTDVLVDVTGYYVADDAAPPAPRAAITSNTEHRTFNGTAWTDVDSVEITVPEGDDYMVAVTTSVETACRVTVGDSSWCAGRILLDGGAELHPQDSGAVARETAIDHATGTGYQWRSHALVRHSDGPVAPGTYTVTFQVAVNTANMEMTVDEVSILAQVLPVAP